jgi:hypothetical protein
MRCCDGAVWRAAWDARHCSVDSSHGRERGASHGDRYPRGFVLGATPYNPAGDEGLHVTERRSGRPA